MKLKNTVVNFHEVIDWEWMEKVLTFLKRHYTMISVNQLEDFYYSGKHLSNCCHVTFDDGDSSFHSIVLPVIRKLKIPVSIYISPKMITNNENYWFQNLRYLDPLDIRRELYKLERFRTLQSEVMCLPVVVLLKMLPINDINKVIDTCQARKSNLQLHSVNMTIDQVMDAASSGYVDIGAHTMNHPILYNENDMDSWEEITSSIQHLSDVLHYHVKYFAYPNGYPSLDYSAREISILKKAGIRLAFSCVNNGFHRKDDRYAVPRKGITYGKNAFIFVKLILGKRWDLIKRLSFGKDDNLIRIDMLRKLSKI